MALAERANYTLKKSMTVAEIMVETDLRERATEKALACLQAEGLAQKMGKTWAYLPEKRVANVSGNGYANENAYDCTSENSEKGVLDGKYNLLKEVEGSRSASYASGTQPSEQAGTRESWSQFGTGQGLDGLDVDATTQATALPSQVGIEVSEVERTAKPNVGSGVAPTAALLSAPCVAELGGDALALQLFNELAGSQFVVTYRDDLTRWHENYTIDFLRLAWKLAPSVPGVKVASSAFAWMLKRERGWPEALKAQYERDLTAAVASGKSKIRVQVGDLLRWEDGATAVVERVDSATVVTDSANEARGYVPLALLGKGVEVLRS
jgi:hypothetical protein